jgi:hypothetical protein
MMLGSMSANQTRTRLVKVAEAFHLRRSNSDCPPTGLAHRLGMRLDEVAKASRHDGVVLCVASRQLRSICMSVTVQSLRRRGSTYQEMVVCVLAQG